MPPLVLAYFHGNDSAPPFCHCGLRDELPDGREKLPQMRVSEPPTRILRSAVVQLAQDDARMNLQQRCEPDNPYFGKERRHSVAEILQSVLRHESLDGEAISTQLPLGLVSATQNLLVRGRLFVGNVIDFMCDGVPSVVDAIVRA